MILEGKSAIVTGGAAGIGHAIVDRYLREGARVILADIDQVRGKRAEKELSGLGTVRFVKADVGRRLDVHNLVAAAIDAFGDIDILVNNAGIRHEADFLDLKEEDLDRVLGINLKGPWLAGQAVARYFIEKVAGGGSPGVIINLSSINERVVIPEQAAYCISKGALSQLTKAMAVSLAPHGIRVNAIGPGSVMTEMMTEAANDPASRNAVLSRTPLGRIGEPEEIAGIATFLASDDAGYVTGQTLFADGGRLALNGVVKPRQG